MKESTEPHLCIQGNVVKLGLGENVRYEIKSLELVISSFYIYTVIEPLILVRALSQLDIYRLQLNS